MLKVVDVSHWFGTKRVLNHVDFEISDGQIVSLVGPSGCGKSTLLRAILGTHPPSEGHIWADDMQVKRPSRHVGIVYQSYTLYSYMTARENVAFGLMLDQTNLRFRVLHYLAWRKLRARHLDQADDLLKRVQLGHAADLYPYEMSGGMRQRVAIAQALIMNPKLLLLDEPFGALDEATREDLQLMLLHLYEDNLTAQRNGQEPPYTILIVTHELNEALYVANRVLGLSQYHQDGQHGATIVYDKAAPVFRPHDARDFQQLEVQKEEIRSVVFDPKSIRHHGDYVSFWEDLRRQADAI